MVFDRRATKHPAKIRAALRVGAAPVPRRVAGSLNRAQLFASPSPCESSGDAPNAAIPASDLVHQIEKRMHGSLQFQPPEPPHPFTIFRFAAPFSHRIDRLNGA